MVLKDKSGSSVLTTPIVIALGIIMVTLTILLAVQIIIPYIWYEKLSSAAIKYIFVMEEYGYLTTKEVSVLKKDLKEQGFDTDKLTLNYTNYKTDYGDPIYLKLVYDYDLKLPLADSKTIQMVVERNSISKR